MGAENIQCSHVYQLLILFIDDEVKPIAENGIFCGFLRMRKFRNSPSLTWVIQEEVSSSRSSDDLFIKLYSWKHLTKAAFFSSSFCVEIISGRSFVSTHMNVSAFTQINSYLVGVRWE
jgi:hypothetical protein